MACGRWGQKNIRDGQDQSGMATCGGTGARTDWYAICLVVFLALVAAGTAGETSELWGQAGEKWDPRSRLPDSSFAGY